MSHSIDRIKEKLAKLIRLSEDNTASDGEIENALNMAAQIMARHQLTRDDIDTNAEDPLARVRMGRFLTMAKGAKATQWEKWLARFVGNFIGSVDYYFDPRVRVLAAANNGRPFGTGFYFYGPEDDVEAAVALFQELQDAVAMLAIAKWGGYARGDGAAYAEGFILALRSKHSAEVGRLKDSDPATAALIVRSEETALALASRGREWLTKEHGIKLREVSAGGSSAGSAQARSEGHRDGSKYDVDRPAKLHKLA